MDIENLETGEHAACGRLGGEFGRFAIQAGVLGISQGLKSIGHGKREAGKGLALKLALGLGSQQTDVDTVGGMLIAGLGQDRGEIGRRGIEPGL